MINKMDNKLVYDHLIYHDIDYFHVSIVNMIHVGNMNHNLMNSLAENSEMDMGFMFHNSQWPKPG